VRGPVGMCGDRLSSCAARGLECLVAGGLPDTRVAEIEVFVFFATERVGRCAATQVLVLGVGVEAP
jgi:hypothetical protein